MSPSRLWAGWRSPYVQTAVDSPKARSGPSVPSERGPAERDCVFCAILARSDGPAATQVVWRDDTAAVMLNAYPYAPGHLLVMPVRHVDDLDGLSADESVAVWTLVNRSVSALKAAYAPDGFNMGANLGRAAGAGLPDHLHLHCLPRWSGDTNFMTTLADTRVMPETLAVTYAKVRGAWPS